MRKSGALVALLATIFGSVAAEHVQAASRPHARPVRIAPAVGTAFAPTALANLSAWYDASTAANFSVFGSSIATWKDLSGKGNTLEQPSPGLEPSLVPAGIDGKSSVAFSGKQYLVGANGAFSSNLFNESTVFIVTNQANATQVSSALFSGAYDATPLWSLKLQEGGATRFDFDDSAQGRVSVNDTVVGPALWTAAGSMGAHAQYLRKNGNLLKTGSGPAKSATGAYPLAVGAVAQGGRATYFYAGEIGEIVAYDRYLSSTESAEVEGYLACKWGLQTRLPANHAYRYACPGGGTAPSLPIPTQIAPALLNPPELRSSNGTLTYDVRAQADPTTHNPTLVYNGSPIPPTLRLLPGDTLVVNLTNALTTPPAESGYTNDVNLHYHGLHVSPVAPGDDSIDMIAAPGKALSYRIAIPKSHPPGLYWYHTHIHGETERDALAGMSGALIIDGIVQSAPQVANMPERVIVAREMPLAGTPLPAADKKQLLAMRWAMRNGNAMTGMAMPGMAMAAASHGPSVQTIARRNPYVAVNSNYRRFNRATILASDGQCNPSAPQAAVHAWTLNGDKQPAIAIRPGEQQFWRMVNAGADSYMDVAIDNAQLQIVAIDGVPLSGGVNTPASITVPHYVLPPGSRVEFIVTGPPAGSSPAALRTNCFDSGQAGNPMPAAVLATINASASPTDLARFRHVQRRAPGSKLYRYRARSAAAIKANAVSNTRTIYYSDQNTINGTGYDPAAPPMYYVKSGTTEEWTIVNTSSQVHTFHIHQLHFVVEAINGATQAQQFVMDNVNVPAATTSGPGSVKVLLDFTDPAIIGTFLFHCHILSHEDGGMMAKIQVGTAPPLNVSAAQINFTSVGAAAQKVTVSGGTTPYKLAGCTTVANVSLTGNTVSIAPLASGSCLLTVSDSSKPALGASVSITVAAPLPVVTLSPTSLAFASQSAASQSATISGGTPPYTVSGCAGLASDTLGGRVLTVAPKLAGTCSLTLADAKKNTALLSVSINTAPVGDALDNLTFHHDPARLGWYKNEVALTTQTVASSSFKQLGILQAPAGMPAFGKVYAQPLFVTAQKVADGSVHNLVIIATETDQIYAFDEKTHAVVWHRDFTNAASHVAPQPFELSACSDVTPVIGITGTPVIDRAQNRLYTVVATVENTTPYLRLHAISLLNGVDAVKAMPVTGTSPLISGGVATIDPTYNMNRGALLEANGAIYVALGTHCDNHANTTHGWVLAYSASTLQQVGSIADTANYAPGGYGQFLGAPWMGGFGPAADAQGNIYFATGNGPFDGAHNFGDSVLKLPGTLSMANVNYFAPTTVLNDGKRDSDLGSGGVMVLPDQPGAIPHLVVQAGKCDSNNYCYKRVLNRDAMGGMQANDAGAVTELNVGGAIFGGPAYFADASGAQHIVYGGGTPLSTLNLKVSPVSLGVQSQWNVTCLECRDHGSQPIVTSNGTQAGSAIVWALKTPGNSGGSISLYAFDALNMSHNLFNGVAGTWTKTPAALWVGGALVSPLVVDGRVYVPSDGAVAIFGLE